ncbi:MAG: DUF3299 domain-containing protein [Betaproteobacteria bacterium]
MQRSHIQLPASSRAVMRTRNLRLHTALFALLNLLYALAIIFSVQRANAQTTPVGAIPDEKLYGYIANDPMPAGTLPWQVFRQVKVIEETKAGKATQRPEFSAKLKSLDRQEVKVYGFVLPLSTTVKQSHFLISPLPTHCPYCVSQGPDSMIEVLAKTPVEYSQWEPIVISGRLELVNDSSLFYRLTNAETVKF